MFSEEHKKFVNQDFDSFSTWLSTLNPYEFTLVATAIGFAIAPVLTVNQQNSLGNFFELIGQVLLTINAQNVTSAQAKAKKPGIKPEIESATIEEEILKIKKEIIQLRIDSMSNYKQ